MIDSARLRLLQLFKERAVSFGRFTLASGKQSTYYINSKKAIFYSEAMALLGAVLWEMTKDLNLQAVGGLEVERLGAQVVAVICIVDRLEGAREVLAPRYNYLPIFTIRDFGIEPPK